MGDGQAEASFSASFNGLHREISRLIYALVRDFVAETAGRPLRTAGILVFQTAGAFCRFHPHWHGLFLEGSFEHDR